MVSLVRRLTGLVTAFTVAACPTLFAVCAERCGHADGVASLPTHHHQAAGGAATPDVTATTGDTGPTARVDAVREDTESCHHPIAAAASGDAASRQTTTDRSLSAASARDISAAVHLTPTCRQCFGDAPVLLAARASDDGSRAAHRFADAVALLPVARTSVTAVERRENLQLRRLTPSSPPSAPLVLRL